MAGLCQDKTIDLDESFNPDSLNEPPLEWPIMLYPGDRLPVKPSAGDLDTTAEGFRVQVTSTQSIEIADSLRDKLLAPFDGQVYISFDPPNYKVRVGNYKFRSEAEKAEERLKRLGYRTAWVIRTRIETHSVPRPR